MKIKGGRNCLCFSPLRWQRVFPPHRSTTGPGSPPTRSRLGYPGPVPQKPQYQGRAIPARSSWYTHKPPYPPYVHIRPNSKPIIRAARAQQGIVLYAMKLLPGLKPGVFC